MEHSIVMKLKFITIKTHDWPAASTSKAKALGAF